MRAFEYANPQTRDEAVRLLAKAETAALAGGTDLLSLLKDDAVHVHRLVNLKSISDMKGIDRRAGGGLRIGALATLTELLAEPDVRREYPSLIQAAGGVRSRQIQNLGTVGGDLCQRPRCWYFRSGYGLLARHQGKSMPLEGDNRYHAILGNEGPAYFVNPSSLAPALIALGASVKIAGPGGEREAGVHSLYRAPRADGESEFTLKSGEIITEVMVPAAAGKKNSTYEVRQREALDWPLAAAAVALELDGARVRNARVVLGHVAPTPWRAEAAEKALAGKPVAAATARAAGEAAVAAARPLSRNKYKVRLARVAVERAILRAAGREV